MNNEKSKILTKSLLIDSLNKTLITLSILTAAEAVLYYKYGEEIFADIVNSQLEISNFSFLIITVLMNVGCFAWIYLRDRKGVYGAFSDYIYNSYCIFMSLMYLITAWLMVVLGLNFLRLTKLSFLILTLMLLGSFLCTFSLQIVANYLEEVIFRNKVKDRNGT